MTKPREKGCHLGQRRAKEHRLLARVEGGAEEIGEAEKGKKAEEEEAKKDERDPFGHDGNIRHADRAGDQRDDEENNREFEHGIPFVRAGERAESEHGSVPNAPACRG